MVLNDLHIHIANILIDCAKNKKVISYSELCEKVDYGSPENMGKVLDPLTRFTYKNFDKTFISVLVVRKDTLKDDIPKPGYKFFEMYREMEGDSKTSEDDIVLKQRAKAFENDWTNLKKRLTETIENSIVQI